MATILETDRLILREIAPDDAEFLVDLMNQPKYHKFIGDKGIKTVADARNFINNVATQSYRDFGFGHYIVELKAVDGNNVRMGTCGFVNRDSLDAPDVGFAFLPQFEGKGFAYEASEAIMRYGREVLGFKRIVAIATPENERSAKLLSKLGLQFERVVKMPNGDVVNLFAADA